jgi:hypothetical protein
MKRATKLFRLGQVLCVLPFLVAGCSTKPDAPAVAGAGSAQAKAEKEYEDFTAANFDQSSTTINNEWLPLKPGTRMTWEGTALDDEGDKEDIRVVRTVTDLTKVIDGVRTVVCWEEDYADGELAESELIFFGQDKEGNIWHFGEYSEEWDEGTIEASPSWIHSVTDGRAGIMMKAKPALGAPSYSQGWSPSLPWTDRAFVYQVGEKTSVPYGSFEDVLVIDETDKEEPNSHQLKFYARGVGNVRVGWRGDPAGQEELGLVNVEQLSAEALADARNQALAMEQRAYKRSKDVYGQTPKAMHGTAVAEARPAAMSDKASLAPQAGKSSGLPGTEEFGLTQRELVQAIERVEGLIARCMREQGFEYVAADYRTVRQGMTADKSLPGLSEEEFIEQHGFGVSTMYTGAPPQLVEGYSPARVGLGERNIQIFKALSSTDRVAYNRALLGENADATFAVGLETEDFSRCGGCTLAAIKQVFAADQLKPNYYNPKDAMINNDPRMKAALRKFAEEMREAGFDYDHPDDVEIDIRNRLNSLTNGGTIPIEGLSADQKAGLNELQAYERRVAKKAFELQEEIFDPVESQIEKEMYAREVK